MRPRRMEVGDVLSRLESVSAADARPVEEVGRLLSATSGVRDEGDRLRIAVSALLSVVPCDLVGAALLPGDDDGDVLLAVEGELGETVPGVEDAIEASLENLVDRVRRGGAIVTAGDVGGGSTDPGAPFEDLGVRSLALLPLRTARSTLGFLFAGRRDPGGFGSGETAVLQVLSEQLAIGIDNLRLQRSLRRHSEELDRLIEERTAQRDRSERRLEVLLELTSAAVASLDRQALFETITETLQDVVTFDRASLTLVDTETDRLVVKALGGPDPTESFQDVGSEHARGETPLWEVVDECRPRLRRDLRDAETTGNEAELVEEGIRSYLSVPLQAKDRVLGTLNVGSREPDVYDDDDADFLWQAAKQFALAVDNMLAYEEIQELKRQAELETEYLREEVQEAKAFGEIIGKSPAIRRIQRRVEQVAPTSATVLIQGESGTGKELVAREVHARSERSDGPMIKVNCASVPGELYESEFFGHVKGAFSGAVRDRAGRFAAADGGTLFLDEVGEIPLGLQSKLLRVLQDGSYQRVGEERTRTVDVRILAATNRDLRTEVEAGRFREDLFYRLNVFPVEVPPLRERGEDIPLLAAHFLEQCALELDRPGLRLTEANVARLRSYDWPGNVRELQNVIERAVITARDGRLRFDLPGTSDGRSRDRGATTAKGAPADSRVPGAGEGPGPGGRILTEEEMDRLARSNIEAALARTGGKIYGPDGAAELLGVPPTTLASRIDSMGIER